MKNQEISRQIQRLEALYARARDASDTQLDLQAHWARYLCILLSGLVENGIKEIYSDFIGRAASKPVADYAIAYLLTVQNPKAEKILLIAGSFKKEWREQLQVYLDDQGRKDAVDSVMANRNQIAHGKDVNITLGRLRSFLDKVIDVLAFIEQQCRG